MTHAPDYRVRVSIDPGWPVALALVVLLGIAVGAHRLNGYGLEKPALVAAARSIAQLGVAALLITSVVEHLWLSVLLVVVMFALGVLTTSRRVDAPGSWPAAATAMAAGVVPVLVVVLATGTIPLEGIAIIPIAGIIVGNAMTAHTLVGRRAFSALRDEHPQYEAALSLGLLPAQAIREIVHRRAPEALLPGLDQVKTTGVVTLPGAFIGVMLGGGSPVQAATAQVLVLFGIMAAQTITVGVAERLVAARRLVSPDLRSALVD
ncbi:ABC transporter permease [Pedococcus soli]